MKKPNSRMSIRVSKKAMFWREKIIATNTNSPTEIYSKTRCMEEDPLSTLNSINTLCLRKERNSIKKVESKEDL
jgi:hypothetical protein